MIRIETIDETSPRLEGVRRLWRANSRCLGYFPEGAFRERARQREIIVALRGSEVCGYVLYGKTRRRRVRLTHLCIDEAHRGEGLARRLIEALRGATKDMNGIGLRCRRDFPSWSVWPKLGFVAVGAEVGRGADGGDLTYFWMQHPHRNLLEMARPPEDDRLDVVLDANVFFDLDDPTRDGAEESLGLAADWLRPSLNLYVTEELLNEIHRQPDRVLREGRLRKANGFECLGCSTDDFLRAEAEIRGIAGDPADDRDAADIRQVARAVAAQATTFVTRDEGLLKLADGIYRKSGLSVVRPAQLVGRFEELRNERQYQPERLAGTRIGKSRLSYADPEVAVAFQDSAGGERRRALEQRLRSYFAAPDRFACFLASDESPPGVRRPLALYVVETSGEHLRKVPLFRIAPSVRGPRMVSTLFRTLLAGIVEESSRAEAGLVLFEESAIEPGWTVPLRDAGFIPCETGWVKPSLRILDTPDRIGQALASILDGSGMGREALPGVVELLSGAAIRDDPLAAWEIEHLLWPAKVLGCGIPSYVVPIRPRWATDLFDSGLADGMLWGADRDLALNPESVYYRAVRPSPFRHPGRILWYVSEDRGIAGSKRVRACSRLTEVVVGPAKAVYRRLRRLGVYAWKDILETAGGYPEGGVMALRFDDTERLARTPTWDQMRAVLQRHGVNSSLQSPVEVPESAFVELHGRGGG